MGKSKRAAKSGATRKRGTRERHTGLRQQQWRKVDRATWLWLRGKTVRRQDRECALREASSDSDPESQWETSSNSEPEPRREAKNRQLNMVNYPDLEAELERMRDFFTREVNVHRRGGPLRVDTWRKAQMHMLSECICVHACLFATPCGGEGNVPLLSL